MEIKRTIAILLPDDPDLRATLVAFQQVQKALSAPCYNGGIPLTALDLQRRCYQRVKGTLNAQMTISAIRLVAGAYTSAKRNRQPITRPFLFKRPAALFLVGIRGRDADFRGDGTISIWTIAGRKRITYTVPAPFRRLLMTAREIDSITLIERSGQLLGRVVLTLQVPEPIGVQPVGIDLNETNALVAVDPEGRTLFISGKAIKVKNQRNRQTRRRLQRKHATRKAESRDTRSVRRVLKRLGRTQSNRTRTFAQTTAKQLAQWAPHDAILVFEDLHIPSPKRGAIRGVALRRRLSLWQRSLIRRYVANKAGEFGFAVVEVNPAHTSTHCSRCGQRGVRKRHHFWCPSCGHREHADRNAAVNIRNRYVLFRQDGQLSICPEALVKYPPQLGVD